jgi:hypothetical protein
MEAEQPLDVLRLLEHVVEEDVVEEELELLLTLLLLDAEEA